MVSNTDYIREVYDSYFEGLKSLVRRVEGVREAMQSANSSLTVEDQIKAEHIITCIEEQIISFADLLSISGVEVVRRCC